MYQNFHLVARMPYSKARVTSCESQVTSCELRVTSWKLKSTSWNSKVRVQIHEFKFTSYEFNFMSYEFKSTSHKIKFTRFEFKSTSHVFKSTSHEFKSTNSRIIYLMKTHVNSPKIASFSKILSFKLFNCSGDNLMFYFFNISWLQLQQETKWININFERRDLTSAKKTHPNLMFTLEIQEFMTHLQFFLSQTPTTSWHLIQFLIVYLGSPFR